MIPRIVPPRTRDEIVTALESMHNDAKSYWNSFDTPAFFAPIGTAWSPADHVRHLIKSTRPVAMALKLPKIVLRFKFGRPKRPSMSFEEVRDKYESIPEKKAGAYAPSSHAHDDLDSWRREIMQERANVQYRLIDAIRRWSERALDSYQLPHPILGNLTVREMLFFTLHHQLHHIQVVERRRQAA